VTSGRRSVAAAVFVSGSGTNLQGVIDAVRAGELPLDLRLVVANRKDALGLERARTACIPTALSIWRRDEQSRVAYARQLARIVAQHGARLVLLLGWMHVLDADFLTAGFDGVLNLHPAYLPDDPSDDEVTLPDGSRSPAFRGAHALRDAIQAGASMTGATLIEITADVDRGPVLARRAMALVAGDDERSALERLHHIEREVVKDGVLRWIAREENRRADDSRRSLSAN
jgi:phosphoribosylglycinamide formyltransferase 1